MHLEKITKIDLGVGAWLSHGIELCLPLNENRQVLLEVVMVEIRAPFIVFMVKIHVLQILLALKEVFLSLF
jgi:hypothetical protein